MFRKCLPNNNHLHTTCFCYDKRFNMSFLTFLFQAILGEKIVLNDITFKIKTSPTKKYTIYYQQVEMFKIVRPYFFV